MCCQLKTIPDSIHIENCPTGSTDEEHGGGGGTVSRGEYRGRSVAVKILHLYLTSDFEEAFGVSNKLSWMRYGITPHRRVPRNFAEKSLPGGTYDTRISSRLLV